MSEEEEVRYLYEVTLERRVTVVEQAKVQIRPGVSKTDFASSQSSLTKGQAISDASELYYDGKKLEWKEVSREKMPDIDEDACTVKRTKL